MQDEFSISIRDYFKYTTNDGLLYNFNLCHKSIVYDVGGYLGDFAEIIERKYGSNILLFEPISEFFEICDTKFSGYVNVKCFNYGLSNANETQTIVKSENSSSMFANEIGESRKIHLRKISEVFEEMKHSNVDLMKLNVEGSEFPILLDLIKTNNLRRIKLILVQFHDFYPNAKSLRSTIRFELAKTHNEIFNYPFVWECWERKN